MTTNVQGNAGEYEYISKDLLSRPWSFTKEIEDILKNLSNLSKEIKLMKKKNLQEIRISKNKAEICRLIYIREIYDEFLEKLNDGIESAFMLHEFIKLSNAYSAKLSKLSDDAATFREIIASNSKKYLRCSQKYSKMGVLNVFYEESSENMIFALFLLDEFHLDKESHENNLWNMAIGNHLETVYIFLPRDLLQIKWLCNQSKDKVSTFSKDLERYCSQNENNKILLVHLCYIAQKFFDCFNYQCSNFILDLLLDILKEKKTDSKEKYYRYYLCKGLLMLKFREYDEAIRIFMEGVKYMKHKIGTNMNKDISIAAELMIIGSVLSDNDFNEPASETLELSLKCLEQYLPYSYDLWLETIDMLGRCYNDNFEFTHSLITLAPAFDYFHIINFGSIKSVNKPVYELAMEMGNKGIIQKITKQLKYPGYVPKKIFLILTEMMVSFSGLGDQTCVFIIKNWIDRCEALSLSNKRLIIENCDYFSVIDLDKVVKKMRKNKLNHEAIFQHLFIDGRKESNDSSII